MKRNNNLKKFYNNVYKNVLSFENSLPQSGATRLYVFSKKYFYFFI